VSNLPSSNGFDVIATLVGHLDAFVDPISHQDVVIRINKEMLGMLDLSSANNTNKVPLRIKDLQSTAAPFSNHNISIRQKTNTNDPSHLTISIPLRTNLPHKLTIRVENLNPMVARISYDIISQVANNNTHRAR